MLRTAHTTRDRDTLLFCSQSNGHHPINVITAWPQKERVDRNVMLVTQGGINPGNWEHIKGSPYHPAGYTHGCLMNSLGARMRDRGMLPAFVHYGASGTHSSWWDTNKATVASFLATHLAELQSPNLLGLLWYQGETDCAEGPGTTWGANVGATISAIRTAISRPTLPLIIVQISEVYVGTWDYVSETRASIAAYAASEGATVIEPSVTSRADPAHFDQPALAALAKQIAAVL